MNNTNKKQTKDYAYLFNNWDLLFFKQEEDNYEVSRLIMIPFTAAIAIGMFFLTAIV